MNIFYTDPSPFTAASQHCIRHQVKMILEYAQLLSTAHHVLDSDTASLVYKRTHENHPCAIWVRQSVDHYRWVHQCALMLCAMFKKRTGREHATQQYLDILAEPPAALPARGFTSPPRCTNNDEQDVCKSYQQYLNEKFEDWRTRVRPLKIEFQHEVPHWYNASL